MASRIVYRESSTGRDSMNDWNDYPDDLIDGMFDDDPAEVVE